MKTFSFIKPSTFLLLFSIILFSCKKEAATSVSENYSMDARQALDSEGVTRLILQPGPSDGQDAYISILENISGSGNGNTGQVPEISMTKWTINGTPVSVRSYLKFTGLSVIPSTAKIVSAELSLYGLPGSSISHPQGNSIYPGSPTSSYPNNSCIISRVTKHNWDESTITWNNQPNSTIFGEAIIRQSTKQWNYNVTVDVTTMVKRMVEDSQNFGFSIRLANEAIYRSLLFGSCEASEVNKRPKLVVRYK